MTTNSLTVAVLRLTVTLIVLCMQDNQTALELAVNGGHSEIVYNFVVKQKMDITRFDDVRNIFVRINFICFHGYITYDN